MKPEKARIRAAYMKGKMLNMLIIGLELPIFVFLGIFLVYEFVPQDNSTLFAIVMLAGAFLGLMVGIYIFLKIGEKYTERILKDLKAKQI